MARKKPPKGYIEKKIGDAYYQVPDTPRGRMSLKKRSKRGP